MKYCRLYFKAQTTFSLCLQNVKSLTTDSLTATSESELLEFRQWDLSYETGEASAREVKRLTFLSTQGITFIQALNESQRFLLPRTW